MIKWNTEPINYLQSLNTIGFAYKKVIRCTRTNAVYEIGFLVLGT